MSDPIAQAAQQLNEPEKKSEGILGEVMGAVHALEEKVEHFIHPDVPALAQKALEASQESGALVDQLHQQGLTVGSIDPTLVEQANLAQAVATGAAVAVASALAVAQPGEPLSANQSAPAGSIASASPISAGTASALSGDLPNAATGAAAQPGTLLSAQAASITAGTSGIVASSPADPGNAGIPASGSASEATTKAGSAIRAHLANIRQHLSIRGFEQSAIADIHKELEAIEGWL